MMTAGRRGALISGTVTLIFGMFLGMAVFITVFVVNTAPEQLQDQIPEDFEPLSERTIRQNVALRAQDNRVAGFLAQTLYGIQVSEDGERYDLVEAIRLYSYCRDTRQIQMCSDYPGQSAIRDAAETGLDNIFPVPEGEDRPYRFTVHKHGEELFQIGNADGHSSFVAAVPIPGGQHVDIGLTVDIGEFSTGVTAE